MTYTLYLNIGSIIFALRLPSKSLYQFLSEHYREYLASPPANWELTLTYNPSLNASDNPWIEHDSQATQFEIAAHRGWMDFERRQAEVSTVSDEKARSAMERVISYICMQELPRHYNGLLIHGAGIVIDGAGYVFFGASGRGKSTVSRLSEGIGQVLTDENLIVRLTPQGPQLISTPFWGGGTPVEKIQKVPYTKVPLRAIYSLHHAPSFTLERLSLAASVMELLSSEKVATERISSADAWLAMTERLLSHVPLYRLGFLPTTELWHFLGLGSKS